MKIKVTLMGPLKKYFQGIKSQTIEFTMEMEVLDLLEAIRLPRKWCSIFSVNGVKVTKNYKLCEGDEVVIYPPVSGG